MTSKENQAILKALLRENTNCSDCKRNPHPRWASWNLGVFICIRCSGIHRSMGTHISQVKSVDLDTWKDEQVQNMVAWGNARANAYWEAGLPEGYVPDDSKIEGFIRTKYERKKWVASPEVPHPGTLGDVPTRTVKPVPTPVQVQQPVPVDTPKPSIFSQPVQSNQSSASSSMLDLNFSTPSRTPPVSNTPQPRDSRNDLKKSILSLYSKPQGSSSSVQSTQLNNDLFKGVF